MAQSVSAHATLRRLCGEELHGVLHNADYLGGLIFAVAAAPEIPMPEQWLVWALDARGQLSNTRQADELTEILMECLKVQLAKMRDNQVLFPTEYSFEGYSDSQAPYSQWLQGLLAGHAQLEAVWQSAWQQVANKQPEKLPDLQKNLRHCLSLFSTFADIPLALEQAREKGNEKLQTQLPRIFPAISQALQVYVKTSGALVEYLPYQFESFVQQNPSAV